MRMLLPLYLVKDEVGPRTYRGVYVDVDDPGKLEVYYINEELISPQDFFQSIIVEGKLEELITEGLKLSHNSLCCIFLTPEKIALRGLYPYVSEECIVWEGSIPLSLSFPELKDFFRTNLRVRSVAKRHDAPMYPWGSLTFIDSAKEKIDYFPIDPGIKRLVKMINENPHFFTSGFSCSGLSEDHPQQVTRGNPYPYITISVSKERARKFEELVGKVFPLKIERLPSFSSERRYRLIIEWKGLELIERAYLKLKDIVGSSLRETEIIKLPPSPCSPKGAYISFPKRKEPGLIGKAFLKLGGIVCYVVNKFADKLIRKTWHKLEDVVNQVEE